MTNLDFIKKSTKEQIASFFALVIGCNECFLHEQKKCNPSLGCRENFRNWLDEEKRK